MPEAPTEDSLTHEEAIMLLCTGQECHCIKGGVGLGFGFIVFNFQNDLPRPPRNGDHNDCNSKITSTNPKWMAPSTTESHENARISPGWKPRMLACWKRSNRCGSSLPVGSGVYLWIGWMLHRLGNRKLLLCSPGGLEERNGMLLRCLYKLREATLIEGTSCLSSCWQQNSFTIWWYWLVIIWTSTNFHVLRGGCSSKRHASALEELTSAISVLQVWAIFEFWSRLNNGLRHDIFTTYSICAGVDQLPFVPCVWG